MRETDLGIREFQEMVDSWICSTKVGYYDELTNMAILAEETGEVARIISRRYGKQRCKSTDNAGKEALAEELGDVIRVCCALANQCDIDLVEAIKKKHEKISKRDADM